MVEVDILSGEWINKHTEVIADIGRSLNSKIDIGQVEGGWLFGSGYGTTENTSELTTNGKIHCYGHWRNKLPTAKSIPEIFNVTLLNVADSIEEGGTKTKGVGEVSSPAGASLPAALRDAVRAFRSDSGKFTNDTSPDDRSASNYMFDMFAVTPEKIRKHTTLSNDDLISLLQQEN